MPKVPKPCTKRRFRTELDAMLFLQRVGRRQARTKTPVRQYRCSLCKGWHITSWEDRRSGA